MRENNLHKLTVQRLRVELSKRTALRWPGPLVANLCTRPFQLCTFQLWTSYRETGLICLVGVHCCSGAYCALHVNDKLGQN